MTNVEKAKKLSSNCLFTINESIAVYNAAFEMARWKDEQMKEALNNILIECDACFDEQTTNTLESIIKHQIEIL